MSILERSNVEDPQTFIVIQTSKFPILPGEDEEIVNPGMYGQALSQYLQAELPKVGIQVPMYCPEDYGWWVEVVSGDLKMGLLIYADSEASGNPTRYAVSPSVTMKKKWSWSQFKRVELTDKSVKALQILDAVERVFRADPEIRSVTRTDEFPFGED